MASLKLVRPKPIGKMTNHDILVLLFVSKEMSSWMIPFMYQLINLVASRWLVEGFVKYCISILAMVEILGHVEMISQQSNIICFATLWWLKPIFHCAGSFGNVVNIISWVIWNEHVVDELAVEFMFCYDIFNL